MREIHHKELANLLTKTAKKIGFRLKEGQNSLDGNPAFILEAKANGRSGLETIPVAHVAISFDYRELKVEEIDPASIGKEMRDAYPSDLAQYSPTIKAFAEGIEARKLFDEVILVRRHY